MQNDMPLRIEHSDGLTTLTIDRPKALNALNADVLTQLADALSSLPEDTRCVVLTGAGDKAFVAGADIKAMSEMSGIDGREFARKGHLVADRIEQAPVPVIAAVNGFALGGGCEMVLACDFAIAADNAVFGLPEVGLGLIPGFGGTTRLSRRVGDARARQLLFTAAKIDAAEALRIGLVNEVLDKDALMPRAQAIAAQIAKNAPIAVAYAKKSARMAEETDLRTANEFEMSMIALTFTTEDTSEGLRAFIEKRAPEWKGR